VTADMRATVVLESRFENIEIAERVLVDMLSAEAIGDEEEYWTITALREAVANAVRHGGMGDPARPVEVGFRLADDVLTITVADCGQGFNPEAVPDPTQPENLLRPFGRGIFYMRRFMDSVDFDSRQGLGTLVTMSRKLTAGQEREIRDEKPSS
jgi:serine/threonine-protein kinase RsbW